MIARRKPVSPEADQMLAADEALAARFDELLEHARAAEQELRDAQAAAAPRSRNSTGWPRHWTRR